jgi:ATP-dependent RNA helicase DeaD
VRQSAYIVSRSQKTAALGRVLDFESPRSAIVFCRTRLEVDELTDTLEAHGYGAQALHGGMEQKQRDRVMQLVRKGQAEILVATDVAARGLDVEHVSHVINYDVPSAPEIYVHRIGRTGRIGREGVAITLADPREHRFLRSLEAATKQTIDVLALPTMADLRAKRLEATRVKLRERLLAGGLEEMRAVVEALAGEFDVLDVAAAAVKLVHDAAEPATPLPPVVDAQPERAPARAAHPRRDAPARPGPHGSSRPRPAGPLCVLRVSAGKDAGIRPADLVGAITGEAGVESRVLGAIRVRDDHALVEVPEALAVRITKALRAGKIRGIRVDVQRERP